MRENGDEILRSGSTLPGYIPGRTQKNIISVGITQDGEAIGAANYSRSGAHEIGHSGGLPHPWMTFEMGSLNILDVIQYDQKGN